GIGTSATYTDLAASGSAAVVWLRYCDLTASDSSRATYGPRTPVPSSRVVYSATAACVMNFLSGVKSAKPTRLRPTSSEDVVLGARIGPSGRPARSVSSVLPFAAGNVLALAVGLGCGGALSDPPGGAARRPDGRGSRRAGRRPRGRPRRAARPPGS